MISFQNILLSITKNPWVFLVASRPLFAYGAGFTSPNSIQRYAVFVVLCLYVGITLANFTAYIQSTGYWPSIIAGTIVAQPISYFDRLICRKWAFENRQAIFRTIPDRKAKDDTGRPLKAATAGHDEDSFGSRLAFGNEVGGTVRGPGTSWEVKKLPRFSSSDPQWVPSPLQFIMWKFAIIIGCSLLNDYVQNAREALNKDLLLPSLVPFLTRLGDVSRDEIWTRVVVGLTSWAAAYSLLQVLFGIPALIGVCLKPSSVKEWRPAFGSPLDAYTMREFWG